MSEGLEWMLELDAKLTGALDMVRALEKADAGLRGVDAGLRKTEDASKKASEGHKRHGKEVEHLEGAFHRLTHAGLEPFLKRAEQIAEFEFIRRGVDALLEAPEKLIEKVKELGEEILKAAAAEERTEAAFGNLFGAEGAKEQIELIDQIGIHTEFTRNQLKDMTLDLAQSGGFKGEALVRARAAVTDIASFSKNAEEGAARAAMALQRINLTGHVDARVLRGVGIAEKTYFGALSERTGKDAKSLKKAMEEGKLHTNDALEALYTVITKKTGKLLGGSGSDMEKLLGARLKHVKEIPEEIFESVKDSRGYAEISDFLGDLAVKFGPDSEFGMAAKAGIAEIFDEIGDKLKGVDLDTILEGALDVLRNMPEAVAAVTETISDLASAVQPVVDAFAAIAGFTTGSEEVTAAGKNAAAWENDPKGMLVQQQHRQQLILQRKLKETGQQDLDPNSNVMGPREEGRKRLKQQYDDAGKLGKASGDGMVKGLRDSAGKVNAAANDNIGGAAEKGARDSLMIKSPSRVFEDIGANVAEGFSIGVERGGMQAAMSSAVAPPRAVGGSGGGGSSIVFNLGGIQVTSTAPAGHDIAQQIADKVEGMVPGMLIKAFEMAGNQAGSA